MKKGLIFATTLAMALGVGVAVGARQAKAAEVKAEDAGTEIYLDVSGGNWFSDNAKVAIWNHQGSCFEEFVSDVESGLYKVTLSAACTSFNLFRGSALNWDNKYNQSEDASFVTGKNLIKSTGYSDGKMTFTWDVYTPLVDPEYHVLGSFNSWTDADDNYILTVDSQDANHYTFSSLVLEKDDQLKVCDVANGIWYGNHDANVVVGEDGSYDIDFYVSADNEDHIVLTKQVVEPVYTIVNRGNAPVEFELDETDKPEGVKHQYSAEIQYACRGGELKFYADAVQITSNIYVDAGDAEHVNNVYGNVTDGFRLRHTANYSGYTKIYLKTYDNGSCSIWGEGYDVDFFSVTVKSAPDVALAYNLVKDETYEPNETYIEQFKTSSAVAMKALAGTEWATSNGIMCDGLSEDVTPEDVVGNNAMQAFQKTAWKVHNDCTEVIYLKIKRTDLSVMMYIGGYEEAHVLTIGGQNVALSKGEGNQYVAHGVSLSAGDAVTAYTIEGEAVAVTSKKVANNNLKEDKTILANVASADIYYDTEAKNLWISGLPAAGQHLLKNGNTAIEMHHTDPFGDYDQYASGMLTFAANDTIKVINTGAANDYAVVWCPEIVTSSKDLAGKFVYDSEKQEMKCVADCSAAVYLKIKSGLDEVYFGDVDPAVDKAVEFANGFKSAMATACSAEEEGKQAAVKAAWALQATAFNALVQEVKDELKKGSTSIADEVIEFGERYAGIYKQLGGKYELEDFLESGIVPNVRFYNELGVTGDNSAMIIVISIAAASALAFTLLLVFKKKKQK